MVLGPSIKYYAILFGLKYRPFFKTYSSTNLTYDRPLFFADVIYGQLLQVWFFFLLCNLHHPNSTIFDTKLDSFLNCVPVHFPRKNSHILDLETEMSYLKLPHMTVRVRRIATRSAYYMCLWLFNLNHAQLFRILPNYIFLLSNTEDFKICILFSFSHY